MYRHFPASWRSRFNRDGLRPAAIWQMSMQTEMPDAPETGDAGRCTNDIISNTRLIIGNPASDSAHAGNEGSEPHVCQNLGEPSRTIGSLLEPHRIELAEQPCRRAPRLNRVDRLGYDYTPTLLDFDTFARTLLQKQDRRHRRSNLKTTHWPNRPSRCPAGPCTPGDKNNRTAVVATMFPQLPSLPAIEIIPADLDVGADYDRAVRFTTPRTCPH